MNKIQIGEEEYLDKVYACWLGKNIGGTLGAPYETKKSLNSIDYYNPIPDKAAPNDDLDLQLVWLKMLEEVGISPSLNDFAEYWKRYAIAYPWNEYGFLGRNLKRGLMPPITGCFENYYLDEMGSPIRSEIWACIAPGDPQLAASMAWKDAVLDHAGGEGMHGEMFWAAVESAAFVLTDPKVLIQIGLSMIPLHTMTSRVVREAIWCFENDLSWIEARERILTYYGHNSPCHAPQNLGFTVLGWLYGKDFGDKLCIAVNCGYDTDCTAATLGATLGILNGTEAIPQKWRSPIGEDIILHLLTRKGRMENAPKTINELTKRTFNIAKQVLQEKSEIAIFKEKTILPENALSLLFRNEKALKALQLDTQAGVSLAGDIEVTLHYSGEPVMRPNIDKMVGISLKLKDQETDGDVELEVPEGWDVKVIKKGFYQKSFLLHTSEIQDSNLIGVCVSLPDKQQCRTKFIILGPNAARGYPSGVNISRPSFKGSEKDWFRKIGASKNS